MEILTTRVRGTHSPLTLSQSFADVAEVLGPLFQSDDEDSHSDEPMGELVWLRSPLRAVPDGVA